MHHNYLNSGWIEVITGCVGSGKREELARRLRRAMRAQKKIALFVAQTTEYPADPLTVALPEGPGVEAIAVSSTASLRALIPHDVEIVAVDEVHLLGSPIVQLVADLANAGIRVICVGLDTDFRGQTFGVIGDLLAQAELVDKLTAICAQCGGTATRSQRLVRGRPAAADDPTILIGTVDYEPRCRTCHMVPELD